MGLKALVKSLSEVPENFRDLYVQMGDEYVLDVDDKDFKGQLQEFRDNNIDLTKQNRELSSAAEELQKLREQADRFRDIDPDKAREAMEKLHAIEEKKLIDAGELDKVVEQRVEQRIERMRADYEGKIQALEKSNSELNSTSDTYKKKLSEVVIDNSLQSAVSKVAAVRQGAMRDILSRGRETWRLDDDGTPIPYGPDDSVLYGTDGKATLTMEEWAQGLVRDAAYLFEPNAGGGAPGNARPNDDGGFSVDGTNQDAVNDNIEAIAAGRVSVRQ